MLEALLNIFAGHSHEEMRRQESGATMAEYALMLALIALVVFAAVQALGIAVNALFAGFPASF